MNQIKNSILISLGFLLLSCNSRVEIPAYIYIDTVDFITKNPNENGENEGTASFKIPDVGVTVNGKDIGTYQLPALIPVIANGNTNLVFEATIRLNGRSEWRPKHPLFTLHKETINLVKGKIDTVYPVFQYLDIAKFPLKEDFEDAGLKFYSVNNGAELKKTQDEALLFRYKNEPNNFSGIIELPASDSIYFFEIQTVSPLQLNSNLVKDCLMELNFCFDANVEIGIYCHFPAILSKKTQQIPIANMIGDSNNTEWNKIYINFTDEMNMYTNQGMTHFDIYMKCGIPRGKKAKFLFDNIKVVYR